jgi:hypothetical protein
VYSPERDALVVPQAVAPGDLASAVVRLFRDARTFEGLSGSASRHVLASPTFAAHVSELLGVIDEFRGWAR